MKRKSNKPPRLSVKALLDILAEGILPLHIRPGFLAREYRRRKALWWSKKAHQKCERCGKPATEIHHKNGRVKWLLIYEPWWMSTCRNCHNWIETNKAYAYRDGWLMGGGTWNRPPEQQQLIQFLKETCKSETK